jgi:hypothetical protein
MFSPSAITSGHHRHHERLDQENHGVPQWRSRSPCKSIPGLVLRPAMPPAAARVDFCGGLGDLLADTASLWLAVHTVRSCVWEASNVDVAFQMGPAVAAFLAKKKDARMSRQHCCAHKGRACQLATTPIKGRKDWCCSPAFVKDIVLLFLVFFYSSLCCACA